MIKKKHKLLSKLVMLQFISYFHLFGPSKLLDQILSKLTDDIMAAHKIHVRNLKRWATFYYIGYVFYFFYLLFPVMGHFFVGEKCTKKSPTHFI